jgi:hypothetical protein
VPNSLATRHVAAVEDRCQTIDGVQTVFDCAGKPFDGSERLKQVLIRA